ncbi:Arginase [Grifola frondosa]|uniref:Arginase n=1 Tax=Grifola frondosa TaxID=5627 RepID=A0A1C7LWN1_GRIFR|nr:Arginase [Grifola frondosa]
MSSEPSLSRFLPDPKTVAIVGCPFRGGQAKLGVDKGPISLVEAGLPEQLSGLGWNVKFDGHHQFEAIDGENDPPIGKLKNPRLVSKVCKAVSEVVYDHAKKGELPLTLGGDHSLAMGTISGTLAQYPDACVIWIDAHADINTADTTDSGNIMPVLKPNRVVYIGLRDVDVAEKRILKENGIKAFSMHEVDKRELPIHLSFDVDALDPSVAPSTGTPVRGGLTFREGHYICESIHETGCLVALDIMESGVRSRDLRLERLFFNGLFTSCSITPCVS